MKSIYIHISYGIYNLFDVRSNKEFDQLCIFYYLTWAAQTEKRINLNAIKVDQIVMEKWMGNWLHEKNWSVHACHMTVIRFQLRLKLGSISSYVNFDNLTFNYFKS